MSENLQYELQNFTGSETWWQYQIGSYKLFVYTDGVKYLAEKANAYWLLDAIASYQRDRIRSMAFQVWELERDHSGNGAVLTMRQDKLHPIEVEQKIEYTDFPMKKINLWLIEGTLLLPSEY